MWGKVDEVVRRLDMDKVWRHVDLLTKRYPDRIAGSGVDREAEQYIAAQLEAAGVGVQSCAMELFNSFPGEGRLEVLHPRALDVPVEACLHIESTPADGVEAPLVYVGAGGWSDYEDIDVDNKVVLAEVSYAPPTPEKARIAWLRGAIGIVLMNWGPADRNDIPMRALKSVWGNPTPRTYAELPRLAGVTVGRQDGERLRRLCEAGEVRVRLTARVERRWSSLSQPIGRIGNADGRRDVLVVGGHFDCWPPGASDNATGVAAMIEIARALARDHEELARDVVFAFWNGHEVAEAGGSTWFVDHEWDVLHRRGVAYFNIDTLGMRGSREYTISVSPELLLFAETMHRGFIDVPTRVRSLTKTADQSFFGVGLPAMTGRYTHAPEQIEEWGGATLGWWNHTTHDGMDKIDRDLFYRDVRFWAGSIAYMATVPVLPMRFGPMARQTQAAIQQVVAAAEAAGLSRAVLRELGFDALQDDVRRFMERVRVLDETSDRVHGTADVAPEAVARLNRLLQRISRVTTAPLRTLSGRYGQDSYGRSELSEPIPSLAGLEEWAASDPNSLSWKLRRTELRRLRNQLADSLHDAAESIDEFLCAIEWEALS